MTPRFEIDTTLDLRTDTPPGADPDAASSTLKRYHRQLWEKPLPSGETFTLVDAAPGGYLVHQAGATTHWMTSDSVIPTYRYWGRFGLPGIVGSIDPAALDEFDRLSYTVGGMMLFPSWTGVRHWSINQARGMLTRIADRMDLTLECLRRHYADLDSPMRTTLAWYADYFALFGDFDGFVRFFLLDDLLTADRSEVRFFLPFDDFARQAAVPADRADYEAFQESSMRFVSARNERIAAWAAGAR